MGEVAVEFDHVWKKFRRGEIHDSLRDLIPALSRALFSSNHRAELRREEFWAIHDVSFQVRRGEAIGIIGPNGAGKSTILKLLSKILKPNQGTINIHGKLSALIEVGAGFHPDLTGRENIYLNATILGMKRLEIDKKFDEIVAFSGVEDFIDTPVKRYSSGMYARLGFSVAAHVDPEILLVDEVLSVGDMLFQEKCMERMRRIVREGTTVIFVSHNLQAVLTLCERALALKGGKIARSGPTPDVIAEYLRTPSESSAAKFPTAIDQVFLCGKDGHPKANFAAGEKCQLRLTLRPSEPLEECLLGFIVHRATDGLAVCDYNLPLSSVGPIQFDRDGAVSLAIHLNMNLLRGAYVISLHVYHSPTAHFLSRAERIVNFFVEEMLSWQGVCHLRPRLIADEQAVEGAKK